jgi:hypothetical protein
LPFLSQFGDNWALAFNPGNTIAIAKAIGKILFIVSML